MTPRERSPGCGPDSKLEKAHPAAVQIVPRAYVREVMRHIFPRWKVAHPGRLAFRDKLSRKEGREIHLAERMGCAWPNRMPLGIGQLVNSRRCSKM